MSEDPEITVKELSIKVGISADGVNWHIKKLKSQGRLLRIGPDKGGHWQVVDNGNY